jgi:hypothetical protein
MYILLKYNKINNILNYNELYVYVVVSLTNYDSYWFIIIVIIQTFMSFTLWWTNITMENHHF